MRQGEFRRVKCFVIRSVMSLPRQLTFVEFYAGVGGWKMALEKCIKHIDPSVALVCAAALDHSDLCLSVYRHNHHKVEDPVATRETTTKRRRVAVGSTFRIENVSVDQVADWNADIFMMSPPCQPHSRQHSNQKKDLEDPRSKSFLHICELMKELPDQSLPQLVLLENVVGFEVSNSCDQWRHVLSSRGYRVAHFHLEPTQVGLPNDRPRYFGVAIRPQWVQGNSGAAREAATTKLLDSYLKHEESKEDKTSDHGISLQEATIQTSIDELDVLPLGQKDDTLPFISTFLDDESPSELCVSDKVINSSAAWCMDIVTPSDRRTSCFTSSYGKFCKGTGSILYHQQAGDSTTPSFALVEPKDREFDPNWAGNLNRSKLRYFSGRELSRLFGFPSTFAFPASVTTKQQWKLVGNSLNVHVAAKTLELGIRTVWKL